ncbi:peptidylprolyl isomerase [Dysgonomonas macrotermitis]|uniref:Periplasmic chaperone for outer membrane proteins SurA n=1 Tax=Dysgonomonas macrotermitis TaxID=1346286 RepID=A0A1M4TRH2_9BACT|nr:peptidylprolyl isomerase [Dysgonomonas macrotermitis]SHE47090.1 periplasmic chaperone for outer membrane proteins SurA [Dysgonomonas macrotermitis]
MALFKKTILFVGLFGSILFGAKAQDNVIDQIVWVVGDEAILKSDVEGVRMQMQLEKERFDGDPYCLIPEQLAVQKLFLHQAKVDSIDVDNTNVTRTVDRRISNAISSLGSQEKLEEYLGKTISQLREEWREQVRDNEIVNKVQQKLVGNVKLTPAEIRNYYTQLPQDSLPFIPTTVEVEIITMNPKVPQAEIDAVKNKLRDFTDRVNKKETDFATLALLYSEDTESAKRGGELGFMGRAQLVPEFANAAFMLNDPLKVSNIVESEYGFHIIQLIEKRGDRVNVRHILLKPNIPTEELSKTTARMDSLTQDLNAKKFTFEEAASYISADKDTRNNKGLMVNKNDYSTYAGTSRFRMEDLPQEVARVVDKLAVGELSKPFTMLGSNGKQTVAIVKVRQRVDAHKANLSDDYQVMKSIVEGKKREEVLKKWVQDKIKATYVRIDDDWKNCDFQHTGWIK